QPRGEDLIVEVACRALDVGPGEHRRRVGGAVLLDVVPGAVAVDVERARPCLGRPRDRASGDDRGQRCDASEQHCEALSLTLHVPPPKSPRAPGWTPWQRNHFFRYAVNQTLQ